METPYYTRVPIDIKQLDANRSISKSMFMSLRVIRLYDIENTLSFPGEETSLGSGLPSHLPKGDVPYPYSPSHGFLHHTI